MQRLFESLAGVRQAHHHIRLNAAFQSDLLWRATFLDTWNGVAMMQISSEQLAHHVWTDAFGYFGCGAVYPDFSFLVAAAMASSSLTGGSASPRGEHPTAGLLPIILACSTWGPSWLGSMVVVHSDNLGAVAVGIQVTAKCLRLCIYCAALSLSGHTSTSQCGRLCSRGPKWLG